MTNNATITVDVDLTEERNAIMNGVQTITNVGFGVVGLGQDAAISAQEQIVTLFNKMVERGEKIEKEGREQFNEFVEARRKEAKEQSKKAEKEMEKQIEAVLHRLNMPSRKDVDGLQRKINTLTRKINELQKEVA